MEQKVVGIWLVVLLLSLEFVYSFERISGALMST